jgi:protein phosphatase
LRAFGISDKGRVRPHNEDCFAVDEALGLLVIADGMGGHNAGEVAARMAVDAIVDHVRANADDWSFGYDDSVSVDANVLRTAIHVANIQILEAAIGVANYSGMGTTIVAARLVGDRLIVAHVGDSRLYLLSNGRLTQITDDDSWVATVLAREPGVDRAVLAYHPMRNALTNVVGARGRTDVHIVERTLTGGDVLLMTTDGVHGVVDDMRLERILKETNSPNAAAKELVAAALARGSRDNNTAIVAWYDDQRRER